MARPSDFYVDMLNEVDEKLAAAGLSTRIVFVIYVDLLWAPQRSRIRNPERFVLMFAPITRAYSRSFFEGGATEERQTEYVRNKLQFPRTPQVNVKYLSDWQAQFAGNGFDFDYHAIWACFYDPNMFTIARVLHKDIRGLFSIGLHGLNSCQNQRMSFPHNLLMDVMARTLWDKRLSFEQIVRESFGDAFGKEARRAEAFFRTMSKLWEPIFDPVYLGSPDERRIARGLKNLPKMRKEIGEIRPVAKRNLSRTRGAVQWSWKYFQKHLELLDAMLPMLEAYLRGDEQTRERFKRVQDFLFKNEKLLHPALDSFMMDTVWQWRPNELEAHLKSKAEAAAAAPALAAS